MESRVLLLAFLSVAACAGFASTSPARRQFAPSAPGATEAPASDVPATNDEVWDDDNDDFDLDGRNWYSQPAVPPSQPPEKVSDYNDYVDDDFAGNSNRVGDNASPDVDDDDDDDDDEEEQDAEEEVVGNNLDDPEFSFLPPRDARLVLQDDDEQSGPIKVRHTGRNNYAKASVASDNDSTEEDSEHPYDFAIDEKEQEDEDKDDEDEDSDSRKDEQVETAPRHEDKDAVNDEDDDEEDEEEDELVSEDEDNKMFDDPEEDAAQVIYGDHVFLY